MIVLHERCRRCERHFSRELNEPPFCSYCRILEGLEELRRPRWFGVRWWCGWTTGHDDVVREHDGTVWQSRQCRSCGRVSLRPHPDFVERLALEKQQERLALAAGVDGEYRAALDEVDAAERLRQ